MNQVVSFVSLVKLECADVVNAPVLLAVSPELIVTSECTQVVPFIDGFLTSYTYSLDTCGVATYTYTITYEDEQVTEVLGLPDVSNVLCYSCETTYAHDLVGEEPTVTVSQNGDVIYTSRYGCESVIGRASEAPPGPEGGLVGIDPSSLFGDGIDGDITVANGATMYMPFTGRDLLANNLTIEDDGVLFPWTTEPDPYYGDKRTVVPEFYRIYVKGTLTIAGRISASGPDIDAWALSNNNNSTYINDGPGGGMDEGALGGVGQTTVRNAQNGEVTSSNRGDVVGGAYTSGYMGGGQGGIGGDAGDAGAVQGRLGTAVPGRFYPCGKLMLNSFDIAFENIEATIGGGSGGGAGGGGVLDGTDAGSSGGTGGNGGTPGAAIYIYASNVVITGTGEISVAGSAGTDGGAAVAVLTDVASGGGGGGGGGGGLIYLVYESLTNNGGLDVSGGAAGAGGSGANGGGSGSSGMQGALGHAYKLNVSLGVFE